MVPNVPWQLDRKLARDVPGAQAEQLPWGAFLPYSKIRALFFHLSIRAQRQTVLGRSPEMDLVTLSGSSMCLLLLSATASPAGPSRASVCRSSAATIMEFGTSGCSGLHALPWNSDA